MDAERLIAEQDVAIHDRHTLSVRISQDADEDFWRVQVRRAEGSRATMSTTVSDDGDNFLVHLIHEAVEGKQSAWHHLAEWGHANLTRPATGFRARGLLMPTTSPDAIADRAARLAVSDDGLAQLLEMVGDDRIALEAARDQVARRLHTHVSDYAATGALTLLNRALAQLPPPEPFDWRVRWARRRKP